MSENDTLSEASAEAPVAPAPSRGVGEAVARLRAAGWRGAVKVLVTPVDGSTLVYLRSESGAWHRGGEDDAGRRGPSTFASNDELDDYLRSLGAPTVIVPREPMLVARGREGAWRSDLGEVADVMRLLGERTVAAFLKCLVGTDRLMTLAQFQGFSEERLPVDSPAAQRNRLVTTVLLVGTFHELGKALGELRGELCGRGPLQGDALWAPLNEIAKRWNDHPAGKRIRNGAGHHLGELEMYVDGIAAVCANETDVPFMAAHSMRSGDSMAQLAWDALLRGLTKGSKRGPELDAEDVFRTLADARRDAEVLHRGLPELLLAALHARGVRIAHVSAQAVGGSMA